MWIGGRGVDEKKCVSITSEEDFSELFYVLLCHIDASCSSYDPSSTCLQWYKNITEGRGGEREDIKTFRQANVFQQNFVRMLFWMSSVFFINTASDKNSIHNVTFMRHCCQLYHEAAVALL